MVSRYVHNRGLVGAEAEDLIAAVFEVAWRKLNSVPTDEPVPWLLTVARNLDKNRIRKLRRGVQLVARLARGWDWEPYETHHGDDIPEVIRALRSLPLKDQELLGLIAWDGLEPSEAAKVLGCSPNAVRVRLHRARQRLARALNDETKESLQTLLVTKKEQEG